MKITVTFEATQGASHAIPYVMVPYPMVPYNAAPVSNAYKKGSVDTIHSVSRKYVNGKEQIK